MTGAARIFVDHRESICTVMIGCSRAELVILVAGAFSPSLSSQGDTHVGIVKITKP